MFPLEFQSLFTLKILLKLYSNLEIILFIYSFLILFNMIQSDNKICVTSCLLLICWSKFQALTFACCYNFFTAAKNTSSMEQKCSFTPPFPSPTTSENVACFFHEKCRSYCHHSIFKVVSF